MIEVLSGLINNFVGDFMIPLMLAGFFLAVLARLGIYVTVKGERRFTVEFEARVERYVNREFERPQELKEKKSFHEITEYLLNKTFFEHFKLKAERRRRRFDATQTLTDRIFGIETGALRLIDDTLKQTRYHETGREPDFDKVSRYVFSNNPNFNKLFGVVPSQVVDAILSVLPGVFIICGILGTFVGIIEGIPALRAMDVTNVGAANTVMGNFLQHIGFAMTSSIIGMVLSLLMTVVNTLFSPYAIFLELCESYKSSLLFVWQESHGGIVDELSEEDSQKVRYLHGKKGTVKSTTKKRSPSKSQKAKPSASTGKAKTTAKSKRAADRNASPLDIQESINRIEEQQRPHEGKSAEASSAGGAVPLEEPDLPPRRTEESPPAYQDEKANK